jgi:hypothetical protein
MRNLTLTIRFCDISQSFVSATKYENTSSEIQLTKEENQKKNSVSLSKRRPHSFLIFFFFSNIQIDNSR